MNTEDFIKKIKIIETELLNFLDQENNVEENYQNFINIIEEQNILTDIYELKTILYLIANISNNHHRSNNFLNKILQILNAIKNEMKQYYSSKQLFKIFKNNKRIILFLIEEKILIIDQYISKEITAKYREYFQPELKSFISEKNDKQQDNSDKQIQIELREDIEKFNEKRKEGENDGHLYKIIRNDSVDEFIAYIKKENYSLNCVVEESIFETNEFLIKQKETTLIEYAAFFGSVQIFKYLYLNKAKMTSEVWLYAIHGCDVEIIHIIEENNNKIEDVNNQETSSILMMYIKESIKCHHNHIANYIANNLIQDKPYFDDINIFSMKYYNFLFFEFEKIGVDDFFIYACKYDYYKIVENLLHSKKIDIENDICTSLKFAANKNNYEIMKILLYNTGNEIKESCFDGCQKLDQIEIPSVITSIGNSAFSKCSSLTQVTIPSSVTKIKCGAFSLCISLRQITIPSSVTEIGDSSFYGCMSLAQVLIPNSVTKIGNSAFNGCSSLAQIIIPSSVTSIGYSVFSDCSSLTQILIHSSITEINVFTFYKCQSLMQITIPSSVTKIENSAFNGCSSLVQITIPSSVTSIGNFAFSECSSLTKIMIPSSVTSIGNFAFSECSSLKRITISSSVTNIGEGTFQNCTSLTHISIPSPVKKIERNAFRKCKSLTQLSFENPSSLTEIGEYCFYACTSLTEISIPSSVKLIENGAFDECISLAQVSFEKPSSLTKIGNCSFLGCSSLKQLSLPPSVTSVGNDAFPKNIQFINSDSYISKIFDAITSIFPK